ncbi:matrix remodeling-associated protein 8 [Gadus morhua]|uniref:matrix remodeling-associated protein 8 n=1 Tax=Gadus morhua TaxID=8049 RepID=UPI0011B829E6|nr:matrix remodeling-associated protein 8-like [Gadus morhua]
MDNMRIGKCTIFDVVLWIHIPVILLFNAASGQSDSSSSVVVAGYNVSAPARTEVVLQCMSNRMVWTQDRENDRQRVVHWDLYRPMPDFAMERVADMFSAGDQRIYNSYNQGRVSLSQSAFKDGNFSLVIQAVTMNDRGLYSCNLHHHYCHLYETIRVQLNVTKSRRKEQRFWDGQKAVYVVLRGSTVVLPCVNRRSVWTDGGSEEEQQVVHWDRQPPGVNHDRADRLVDLYASGEQRSYGSLFLRRKMNISSSAFAQGDFSLTIADLQPTDQGSYSCHLHHHYCGLHERRVFQLNVGPPLTPQTTLLPVALPKEDKETTKEISPRVINVILPDQRHHFLLPLGYVLTTFLLLAFIILIIILITRRHRSQEFYPQKSVRSSRSQSSSDDFEMEVTDGRTSSPDDRTLDYKNNLLKEMVKMTSVPKVIDLDKEMEKFGK